MTTVLSTVVLTFGLIILVCGLIKLTFVPLSLVFEIRNAYWRKTKHWSMIELEPLVSVIVPGFNEQNVLENCVVSIVNSNYHNLEVVLIDDGSTDQTPQIMAELEQRFHNVRFFRQENQGKGAALNYGITKARGDILLFVDSDGLFSPDTVTHMLLGFNSRNVGAVCGDDRPVNIDRTLTRLLAIISHVGTGMVRRALTMLHCMPIVSGNVGAFRRDVLEKTGFFNTDTVGEDLELTWRIHKHGYSVNFAPKALVYAESPSTIRGLWKQRVRWARGLLQTTWMHRHMVGNFRYGMFGFYLLFNTITMIVVPILQVIVPFMILPLVFTSESPLPNGVWETLAWLGLFVSVMLVIYAIMLNKAYQDLRFAWTLILWPAYSTFVGLTMIQALILELRRAPNRWNKLERTGVVTIKNLSPASSAKELTTSTSAPIDQGIPTTHPVNAPQPKLSTHSTVKSARKQELTGV
ncbi:glycosyltransferase [Corynebacterium freiburgense]|uniref:glycosyltransferase n=1 Tax=Corynebacterium freiburgense TaxID=556548 RepID=UPI00041055D8|nr:glycosyltransferase family 2 protein [Corynebacterium freiburgense]WJZ03488.1 Poly-beta-1,6-N-acetyl-D-glucosamine synthase [Corynebacterium freiburgense]